MHRRGLHNLQTLASLVLVMVLELVLVPVLVLVMVAAVAVFVVVDGSSRQGRWARWE